MKSILIDVKKQEVKEVEHDDTLASIYKHVDCGTFDVVNIDGVNSIYVDDVSLAGNGLVLGVDEEGETTSPTLMLEEVKKAVTFLPEGFEINPSIKVTAWH